MANTKSPSKASRSSWKILDTTTKLAVIFAAPKVSKMTYRVITGTTPPKDGRDPEISTRDALLAAAIGGAAVEVTRTIIRRSASVYWLKSTGEIPPGMKKR